MAAALAAAALAAAAFDAAASPASLTALAVVRAPAAAAAGLEPARWHLAAGAAAAAVPQTIRLVCCLGYLFVGFSL